MSDIWRYRTRANFSKISAFVYKKKPLHKYKKWYDEEMLQELPLKILLHMYFLPLGVPQHIASLILQHYIAFPISHL